LTDQIRRASRSVSSNIGEAWRKRRYPAAFVSRLSDAETEATETQVWTQFAVACKYMSADVGREIRSGYDQVIGKLVNMINHPEEWVLRGRIGKV
jgi:four helix bundle protein